MEPLGPWTRPRPGLEEAEETGLHCTCSVGGLVLGGAHAAVGGAALSAQQLPLHAVAGALGPGGPAQGGPLDADADIQGSWVWKEKESHARAAPVPGLRSPQATLCPETPSSSFVPLLGLLWGGAGVFEERVSPV